MTLKRWLLALLVVSLPLGTGASAQPPARDGRPLIAQDIDDEVDIDDDELEIDEPDVDVDDERRDAYREGYREAIRDAREDLRDAPADAPKIFPFRGISLGPRFSVFKPDDGDEWVGHGGLQLRIHMSKIFALEGSAEYRRRRLAGGRVDIFPVQASLLAYLIPNPVRIVPFILGGGGWYFTHVDTPTADDTRSRFGAHAGGGLQLWLHRNWSVDASYRHFWLEDIEGGSVLNQRFEDNGHQLTGALNFHF
jgi:hypothetical protein